ncbi:hypothetical protein [Sinomicrobium oceani]|uniref:hypothetical protein n=1 Tax=Sinomicrobium oceani TaxID=1150368 RepID=UPI00227B3249|nr:hypothetical protein [Sinomicrobium oceani]
MYIKDINGKEITITDLKKAIAQAKAFKNYRHENPGFAELDDKLREYWTDMYKKLLRLHKVQKDDLLTYKKQNHETD